MIIDKFKILKNLHDKKLFLHEVEKDTIEDVKHSYAMTTGNIPVLFPDDNFFVMDESGNVVHIGNLCTLQSFAQRY